MIETCYGGREISGVEITGNVHNREASYRLSELLPSSSLKPRASLLLTSSLFIVLLSSNYRWVSF